MIRIKFYKYHFLLLITLSCLNSFVFCMSRARRVLSRQIRPISAILLSNLKESKKAFSQYRSFATNYRPKYYNFPRSLTTNPNYRKCKNNNEEKYKKEREYINYLEHAANVIIVGSLLYSAKKYYDSRKPIKISDEDKKKVAYHEAGHALVGLLLSNNKIKMKEITIKPKEDNLGHVLWHCDSILTKNDLQYLLKTFLGGRVAEELIYKEFTNSISGDLELLTTYAHKIICEYGMNEKLGFISYNKLEHISQATALKIEEEMKKIIEENYKEVYELLDKNRDKLEKLAQALLVYETLTPEQALKIIND